MPYVGEGGREGGREGGSGCLLELTTYSLMSGGASNSLKTMKMHSLG